MKSPFFVAVAFFVCSVFAAPTFAGDNDWRPVDPAEMALKASRVEPGADAEALFWEVRLLDELDSGTPRTVLRHYIRIKIFNERGRETLSKIDISYLEKWRVTDIAARTITPDNRIIELKKEDIFDRSIVRSSGLKVKTKSFALPGVEAGSIVEYRWREVRNDSLAYYIRLQFQREVPVRLVKYYIKPLDVPGFTYGMRAQPFHGSNSPFVKEKDGFYSTTMENVPAFREEPRMPPEDQVRPWMLIYYSEDKKLTPTQFWIEKGKDYHQRFKTASKLSDDVKKAAADIVGDAQTPEQKLTRLFDFCRTKIKNLSDDASGLTSDDIDKLKDNKSPSDTLKRGTGTGWDIDMLFAAMVTAAGFEARLIRLADRSDTFFSATFADDYFLDVYDIAVKVGDQWRFFDPGSTYVSPGMLRWQEEGVDALLADPKEPTWVQTPMSLPDKSLEKRTGNFRLLDDGTLEGDVTIEYIGHLATDKKEFNDDDSPAQREETLRDTVKGQMSTAELSNLKIENVTDPVKPFVYSYHVRVPGYAQRTGKRIFFQPGFFSHGAGPLFSSANRQYDVYFHYPWSEKDEITIELPEGFAIDSGDSPPKITPEMTRGIAAQEIKISVVNGRTLKYERSFFFGGGGSILFPVEGYEAVKRLFDVLRQANDHTITLKQSATN
jgi:hypothetical protein